MRDAMRQRGLPLLLCAAGCLSLTTGYAQPTKGLDLGGSARRSGGREAGRAGYNGGGSWASGYGMHLGRGGGGEESSAGKNLPLLRRVDVASGPPPMAHSNMRPSAGHHQQQQGGDSDGSSLALRGRRGERITVEEKGGGLRWGSGELPHAHTEARSVADIVSDSFTVPVSGLDISQPHARARVDADPQRLARDKDAADAAEDLPEGVRFEIPDATPSPGLKRPDHPAYVEPLLPPLPPRPQATPKPFVWPPLHLIALAIAALLLLVVYTIAGYNVVKHMEVYNWPGVQRHVIVIHMMAPVHVTCAFVSLVAIVWYQAMPFAPYVVFAKDMCMAYVFVSLFWFMVDAMGGEKAVAALLEGQEEITMPFPLGWTKPWAMGFELLFNVRFGMHQFAVAMPALAVLRFCAVGFGISDGSLLDPIDISLCVLALTSAVVAVYCIFTLYTATWQTLGDSVKHPIAKILTVLGVIFVVYIQGVLVRLVAAIVYLPTQWQLTYTVSIIIGSELWFVHLEMVIFALLINHYFPSEEFKGEPLIRRVNVKKGSTKTYSVFV